MTVPTMELIIHPINTYHCTEQINVFVPQLQKNIICKDCKIKNLTLLIENSASIPIAVIQYFSSYNGQEMADWGALK